MKSFSKQFLFTKQFIFVAVGVAILVAGGISIWAVNNRGAAPVAWWKMDEGQGQTAYDASGNSNSGTLGTSTAAEPADPTWKNEESCKNGKCLQFDGSNDYVYRATFSNVPSSYMTISAWVKTSSATKQLVVAQARRPATIDGEYLYSIEADGTQLFWDYNGGYGYAVTGVSNTNVADGNWHYITFVKNGTSGTYYLDGQADGTKTAAADRSYITDDFVIGKDYRDNSSPFNGSIDDIRVYNYARTAAQIKADYNKSAGGKGAGVKVGSSQEEQNAADGLVGYWKMDEASWAGAAGEVVDSSGNGNNGTSTNGANTTSTAKFGMAGSFDGTDDYVNIPDSVSISPSSAMSIELWVKPGSQSKTSPRIIQKGYTSSPWDSYVIVLKSGDENKIWFGITNTAGQEVRLLDPNLWTTYQNLWTHIVGTYNGSIMNLYINGNLVNSTTSQSGNILDTTAALKIASQTTDGNEAQAWFNGLVDDVKIYNKARSAEQIRRDYETGPPPIMHLKMDENTGQYAFDTSGANNGTVGSTTAAESSDPQWTNGKFGSALKFDGADDYMSVSDADSLDITSAITLEAWVETTNAIPVSCAQIKEQGASIGDGYYTIDVDGSGPIAPASAYCLMDGGWTRLNSSLSNSTAAYGANDVITANNVPGGCGSPGYAFTVSNINVNHTHVRTDFTRTTSVCQCAGMVGVSASSYYWSGSAWVSYNNMCVWSDGVWANSTATNMAGLKLAWRMEGPKDSVNNQIKFKSECSSGDTGQITATAYVNSSSTEGLNSGAQKSGAYALFFDNAYAGGKINNQIATTTMPKGWNHVVLTYDKNAGSSQMKLYVNGILKTQTTLSETIASNANNFYIGKLFNGPVDDVRIYNYARTQKQIMEDMNASHPAVGSPVGSYAAYWKLDEGQGTVAYDSSVNKSNCTMSGTSYWTMNGKFGKAFNASGDDIATCPYIAIDNRSFSVSGWIKFNSLSGDQALLQQQGGTTNSWLHLLARSSKLLFAFYANDLTGNTTLATGQWYYVTFVYQADTNRREIYLNGVLDAQDTSASDYLGTSGSTILGKFNTSYLNGLIDEVKIYQFALSPAEIKEEFNRGVSLKLGASGTENDGITPSNSALSTYCVPGDTTSCAAPVAHWKMDEKADNTCSGGVNDVCDTSGNSNNGANTGGPVWKSAASCKIGSCLSFDGTDDYVDMGTNSNLQLSNFTVSAWFKWDSEHPSDVYRAILAKSNNNGNGYQDNYLLAVVDSSHVLSGRIGGGVAGNTLEFSGTTVVQANQWYHVALAYNGTSGTGALYVNGNKEADLNGGSIPYASAGNFTIGSWTIGVSNQYGEWDGLIDDVRVYNYVRTAAQVAYDYNRGGPVASWSMDSVGVSASPGTALNVYDSSGKANTGVSSGETMNNGTITGATWKDGSNCKYGACLKFDGIDDYVSVSGMSKPTLPLTIEFWTKPNIDNPVGMFDSASGVANVLRNFSAGNVEWWSGNPSVALGLTAGNWYHLVFIFRQTTVNVIDYYRNGVLVTTASGSSLTDFAWTTFVLGNINGGGAGWFNGIIDDVRIYNTALTATQVAALYNNNDRAAGASLEANLVGEWRLDENASLYAADTHYQRNGKYGYAMNFDGSNDYTSIPHSSSLVFGTNDFSISLWTYRTAVGVQGGSYFRKGQYTIGIDTYDGVFRVNTSAGQLASVTFGATIGVWEHHIFTVTQNSTPYIKHYINGVLNNTGYTGVGNLGAINSDAYSFIIGYSYAGELARYFNGSIDDVRIYNYALTPAQTKTLFNESSAVRFGPTEGLP